MRRCRHRMRLHLLRRIPAAVVALRTSTPPRMVEAAVTRSTSIPEKPGLRAGLFAGPGSVRVQFKKVLRGQISKIVTCILKGVSIHSGQRGYGRMR